MKTPFKQLGSLRFTVILLALSTFIVLLGTLDQANYGIYHAQEKYFTSWFVLSPVVSLLGLILVKSYPANLDWLVLPLPGGMLLGTLLGINLILAHIRYYKPGWRRMGIGLIHGGLVLLIVSGFIGGALQQEWNMAMDEGGDPVNHLSAFRGTELALVDLSDEDEETHHVVDESALVAGNTVAIPDTGLRVRIDDFTINAVVDRRSELQSMLRQEEDAPVALEGGEAVIALVENPEVLLAPLQDGEPLKVTPDEQRGLAAQMDVAAVAQRPTYQLNERNMPAAIVTIDDGEGSLGTWLVSHTFGLVESLEPQTFEHDGKRYEIELRFPRKHLPFSLKLEDFTHRRHPNTDIPAEFASDVTLVNPGTGENRHVRISMNDPLRYGGYAFYQASFANDDTTSVLQVVRNPSWLLPYISITIIGVGLVFHFILRLFRVTAQPAKPHESVEPQPSTPHS